MSSFTKYVKDTLFEQFPPKQEQEFVQWMTKYDAGLSYFLSRVSLISILCWIFLFQPLWQLDVALTWYSITLNIVILSATIIWTKIDTYQWTIRRREIVYSIGSMIFLAYYCIIFVIMDVPGRYAFANGLLNVAFLSAAHYYQGRRQYFYLTNVVSGSMVAATLLYIHDISAQNIPNAIIVHISWQMFATFYCFAHVIQREKNSRREFLLEQSLAEEKVKSDKLLSNILPAYVIERFKNGDTQVADGYDNATVLFADIVGFTELSRAKKPGEVVAILNNIFTAFDRICNSMGVEKIKTVGDAYMAVSGVPESKQDHAARMVLLALELQAKMEHFNSIFDYNLKIRIGIHSGPVLAGVIGKLKYAYDVWGDTVNIASRIESQADEGAILISEQTKVLLPKDLPWREVTAKNLKGVGFIKCGEIHDRRSANRFLSEYFESEIAS